MNFQESFAGKGIERNKEKINDTYRPIIESRDQKYSIDVEKNEVAKIVLSLLEPHNRIVQKYAEKLSQDMQSNSKLTSKETTVAMIATDLHDCGKLNSSLFEHHLEGSKRAQEIIDELIEKKVLINGLDLSGTIQIDKKTISIKDKICQAIERHMNHPFLVKKNGGKRFPEPQDNIDKIVFDSDMLANIGFKNIGFQLNDRNDRKEDLHKAEAKGISYIQAVFEKVIDAPETGVRNLEKIMTTEEGRLAAKELIAQVIKIYKSLNFVAIQKKIDDEGLDSQAIKELLDEEIKEAGSQLPNVNDFLM